MDSLHKSKQFDADTFGRAAARSGVGEVGEKPISEATTFRRLEDVGVVNALMRLYQEALTVKGAEARASNEAA